MSSGRKGNVDEPKGGDGELFSWVADFEAPEVAKATTVRAPRRALVPGLIGGGAFVLIGSALIAAFLRPFDAETGAAEPTPLTPPAATSPSTAAPTEPQQPGPVSVLPAACSDLYGRDMLETLEKAGLHHNEVWTGVRDASAGSRDEVLGQFLLDSARTIDCYWLDDEGGNQDAVLTVVTEVTPEQTAAIEARLIEIGQTKTNDRHGLRYFTERRVGAEVGGEAHYLRGGLWFATHWYGTGPFGYTTHMADEVFSRAA